ncbi:UBC-like protein [Plenodomus tracheiphilus IPT5]|uniref:UBC-like protein n=1 Tax=Plenodomus tracheiphilus IPT5 TaxID=1408161 RepID=A0A6A7BMD8_9PLEO|nr:UBC-like protein [Plenodomus tracheiphilus IPT5]
MNPKSLRRLAGDHGSFHTAGLPPNYLFPPSSDGSADLTSLDVLLAGPVGTPYAGGVWRLHLDIPPTYPAAPPTAQFRTRLWHPNIDEATGAVCVETLKRDWSSALKLRDVLVTISCLLIQPNPSSALNEAAGKLASDDWDTFCRRAKLMTEIHAPVPAHIADKVKEAQMRGEETIIGQELSAPRLKPSAGEYEHVRVQPSTSRSQKVSPEDEENARYGGETQEPDSDPESDWIPGPNNASKVPVTRRDNNTFGIQGLEGSMQLVRPNNRISALMDPSAAPMKQTSSPSTIAFTTMVSKRATQISRSLSPHLPIATSSLTPNTADTPAILKFSHQNSFSVIQPNNQSHPLLRGFSNPWDYTRAIHDTELKGDGASRAEIRKRMGDDDFEAKQSWEMKRFKRAGFDLARYNCGAFGPRTGIRRL